MLGWECSRSFLSCLATLERGGLGRLFFGLGHVSALSWQSTCMMKHNVMTGKCRLLLLHRSCTCAKQVRPPASCRYLRRLEAAYLGELKEKAKKPYMRAKTRRERRASSVKTVDDFLCCYLRQTLTSPLRSRFCMYNVRLENWLRQHQCPPATEHVQQAQATEECNIGEACDCTDCAYVMTEVLLQKKKLDHAV